MTENTINYQGRRMTLDAYVNARSRETGRTDQQSLNEFAQNWGDLWAAEGEHRGAQDGGSLIVIAPAEHEDDDEPGECLGDYFDND